MKNTRKSTLLVFAAISLTLTAFAAAQAQAQPADSGFDRPLALTLALGRRQVLHTPPALWYVDLPGI